MWLLYALTIIVSAIPCLPYPDKSYVHSARTSDTHMVSIRVHNIHICTGTLITEKHIITAAYCCYDTETLCLINHEDYNIVAGHKRLAPACETYVRKVQEVIIHKDFSYSRLENNIALFKLKEGFPEWIQAVFRQTSSKDPTDSTKISVYYGWGFADKFGDQLQFVRNILLPKKTCIKLTGRTMDGENCSRRSVCKVLSGDFGGPLMCGEIICGINAYSNCAKSYQGFLNLQYYAKWIEKIQRADGRASFCRNNERLVLLCFIFLTARYIGHIM